MRGPFIVVMGIVVVAAGVWWGVVRDGSRSSGNPRTRTTTDIDLSDTLDQVSGCRVDTCRIVARRDGFRLDGDPVSLVVVAKPGECAGFQAAGVHLADDDGVVWSAPEGIACGDPLGGIEVDRSGNAFLLFPATVRTDRLVILRVGEDVDDFGTLDDRFTGVEVRVRDRDGDGFNEVSLVKDCEPPCDVEPTVFEWDGKGYEAR